jgi:hypothetical protein
MKEVLPHRVSLAGWAGYPRFFRKNRGRGQGGFGIRLPKSPYSVH